MEIKIYRFSPFSFHQSVDEAIDICKFYGFTHLPIVEKGIFRGMLRCDDLLESEKNKKLENYKHVIEKIYVSDKMPWTDVLKIMMHNEANVVGVLNKGGNFVGILLLDDILEFLSTKEFVTETGYILTIRKSTDDFSVSQVAQIVESDGGEILGILLNNSKEETEIEIKIKTDDINEIIQTFRRYDYVIVSQIDEDLHLQELKEHSAFLKRYLEIGK